MCNETALYLICELQQVVRIVIFVAITFGRRATHAMKRRTAHATYAKLRRTIADARFDLSGTSHTADSVSLTTALARLDSSDLWRACAVNCAHEARVLIMEAVNRI